MRVGIDGRALPRKGQGGLRQARGVARYAGRLVTALAEGFPGDEWRVLLPAGATPPDGGRLENVVARRARLDGRLARAAGAVAGRPRLDRALGGDLDAVWLPAPGPAAVSRGVPYVLTLHDLSFVSRPQDFGAYERLWARLARIRRLAAGATALIAISEATRAEAVGRLGLEPDRVHVVLPGAPPPVEPAPEAVAALRRRLGLPERYFLFVGALEPRKAPEVLVSAHAEARRRGLAAELVLAGEGRQRAALEARGARLLGRVADADLAPLYAGAVATVLPSRLEGFGFTPLESLAAGTPAVVSDLPALREVLGEGALRVPPGDPSALADALLAVEADEELRRRLVSAGRAAAALLTWEGAARGTRAVLERAARQ